MLFEIPIVVLLLQSIPEAFFIIMVGLKLFHIDIKGKEAILVSVIYGVASYFIRKYIAIYGIHTILSIIVLIVLLKYIKKISLFYAMISILLSFLLTGIFQSITVPFVLDFLGVSLEQFSKDPKLMIIAAIPTFVLMTIIYFILNKTNFYLYDLRVFKKE
ncbi:hypothetical protein [Garciella nitratireducens]|uniref:Uncharacterized protein n=1 Tax=Garciella nitratireducens DSM 15102 TaxID=1121911 RepID=A0A1T4LSX8_9FIRM|nr:hypothetical protein [Garciella nitratireducens]SJZ57812.1 hypothetical protein SAMN02745973_01068 [Garciella nitratireducens DSM 15102]